MTHAQTRVACIGNSITQGIGATLSYPARLQTLLGAKCTVQNDGVSTTTMLKNGNFPYWKYGKLSHVFTFQPHIVTIKLGTNDTKPVNWDAHNTEFKRDYLAMIDTLNILSTKPRIFLVLPAPIWSNTFEIRDSALQKIMVIIRQIGAERSLPVIDCNAPLLPFKAYLPDGVHPNDAGADSIARIIYRSISGPVSTAERRTHASASSGSGGQTFFPVFQGCNLSAVLRQFAPGTRCEMRVFNVAGALVSREIVGNGTSAQASALAGLASSPEILWISVRTTQ
jgi:lysophospholipase L1-like esterase